MADAIVELKSIGQLHQLLGLRPPKHPLISVVEASELTIVEDLVGQKLVGDFYYIALKDKSCGIQYGRNTYDFAEGVLMFTAPGQVVVATEVVQPDEGKGWMLFFHPDLIRHTNLGREIDQYSFFNYEVYEALHLSPEEEAILTDGIRKIQYEYRQRIDGHTQRVIVSNLELLLNYCLRFYERQFHTRSSRNKDVISQFEAELKAYFAADLLATEGIPNIAYFAEKAHLSPHYFSDLLKKETGRSAKDHINDFLVEQAKQLLLNSTAGVSEIAYELGFNYPHYFTRLFKAKTGLTPVDYRRVN
jgi:AraC-like DNA-binding protein